MFVVHTACASMPSSCRGRYRKVYVIQVMSYDWNRGWRPTAVTNKGVRLIRDYGPQSVGKTERCAYQRALKHAEAYAQQLNNAGDVATAEDIIGAGGSA